MASVNLPIEDVLSELRSSLESHNQVILQAPPGAGKTTMVPISLLKEGWLGEQKILMLEPRRLAAKAAATRIAELMNETVGETVGYRMRMETCCSDKTRIEVITEGILTRMLQTDPSLDGIGLVIFDEFHERSLDADFGLALCLESSEYYRDLDPLKLLVMSATLDTDEISRVLDNAPIISSMGRSYPVDVRYSSAWKANEKIENRTVQCIRHVLSNEQGNILVFLPGMAEIHRCIELLRSELSDEELKQLLITPLYGNLNLEEQRNAILPPPRGYRKIVLATSIAETSLTIEGIRIVIDSGLSRSARHDVTTGMTRLRTHRAAQATTIQRAGRAGRLEPGVCFRLWSADQQEQLAKQANPEILEADLNQLCLQLHQWGCQTPDELNWLTPPPKSAYRQSQELLIKLGALDISGNVVKLTPHGEAMANFPTHPRLSHMLLTAGKMGLSILGAQIAALLAERDPFKSDSADIITRLEWLNTHTQLNKGLQKRIRHQQKRFEQLLSKSDISQSIEPPTTFREQVSLLITLAWPDRLGRQKGATGRYLIANGRAARLDDTDSLSSEKWISVAHLTGRMNNATDTIRLACGLNPDLLEAYLSEQISVSKTVRWDSGKERVVAEEKKCFGAIVLSSVTIKDIPVEDKNRILIQKVRETGLKVFSSSTETQNWLQRVRFLQQNSPQGADVLWPDITENKLLETVDEWLTPWLSNCSSLKDLQSLDIKQMLASQMDWNQQSSLERLAPESLLIPSGRKVRLNYEESIPTIAVKLQEMFGSSASPVIGYGTVVQLHLLSPAGRPLQITQDIAHFWKNTYPEVKKEMKGRYPKHPWPDDPLTAIASAKTKKHLPE